MKHDQDPDRHSLLRVGEPRAGTDGRVAGPHRVGGAPDAVSQHRHGQHRHHVGSQEPAGVNDGEDPGDSADPDVVLRLVAQRAARPSGSSTPSPRRRAFRGVEVYWFDDTGSGQVRVPASWRVMYKVGDTWMPVETPTPYGVAKDAYNAVTFTPVTTSGLGSR